MYITRKFIASCVLIAAFTAPVAFGQSAVIEQSRIGGATQKNNPDFVFTNFTSTTTGDHSTAPGIVSGISTSSRIAATGNPGTNGDSVTISPNGGNGTISNTSTLATGLQIGTTYLVSVSFNNNSTAASPDIVVTCSDTGMSGIDTFNGASSTAFQSGNGYNKWIPVGYITPGTANPTIQFSYASGVSGRWNVDSILFSPIAPPPSGTYEYWNTGSPGGSGTWDTTSLNWNTAANGSGTQGVYNQADLADFGGTAGTVTIQPAGITTDGGLEFDTTGYVVTGGTLTLGSSPSTSGTNIAVVPGANVTINSVVTGAYGFGNAYLGTITLGAPNTVTGTFTLLSGTLALGVNQNFPSLAGSGTLNLKSSTLTVGSDNTSTGFSGNIIDNGTGSPGALIKTGTGMLTLTGNDTFAGKTTVNSGTLAVSADSGLGAAPASLVANQLTLNGNGSALFSAGSGLTVNAKRGITVSGVSNVIAANTTNRLITLLSPITGSGGVVIPTGFIEFDATNTFAGDLLFALTNVVSARFETNNSAGAGQIHVFPQVTTGNDPITLRNDLAVNTTLTNTIFYDESVTNAGGYYLAAYLSGTNVGTLNLAGNFAGTATGGVSINDSSSGTSGGVVILSGNNSGFPSAFNLEGGTLAIASPQALGSELVVRTGGSTASPVLEATTPLTGANAETNAVFLNLSTGLILGGSNSYELAGPIHLGAQGGVSLQLNNTASTIFSGPIDDQGLGLGLTLNSSTSGTLVLKGSNTYSGGTVIQGAILDGNTAHSIAGSVTINGGTLELDNANAMVPTAALTVNSGTVNLNFVGYQTNAALIIGGNQPYGVYGAGGNNPNGVFTGTGYLVVSPSFAITSQGFDTNNNLVVCWQSTPGYSYDVLTNVTLVSNGTWTPANGSPLMATNTTTCYTLPGGNANTNVFVLIRADNVTP
jgi:autotransporter-associated beta strand protein